MNSSSSSSVGALALFSNVSSKLIKMESTLFVCENLSFSKNLRCLNLPLLVGGLSQKRSLSLTCFVFAGQNVHSGKFKHLKYSENVNFAGTNNVDSILDSAADSTYQVKSFQIGFILLSWSILWPSF